MRFNKIVNCKDCKLKCQIYQTVKEIGGDYSIINPLHVFYKKHEYICKQGQKVSHAIYLVDGSAKLYIEGLNDRNIALYILTPKSYIGLLSFFESPIYNYSVKALEDCQICMVDLDFVKKLYVDNHNLLLELNQAFGKSVSYIMEKIITLNQKNIRGRIAESILYLSKLYNSDEFEMRLTRKDLGELSAISEENAVRLLSEFKAEGIIKVCGRRICILDKKLLVKISEVG